ncbi:MAG: DUF3536 domain-containing protein, partial [Deltaproteobacteria bacterium]|nr:DUF3536 domain-containing protein [Deltaproteobacteria bacterium]
MTSPRYLIIHGHFYQPPRENPWSGTIGIQPSAAPWPDWNMRINRECYAPNTLARLLDSREAIARIINNYEYLSFNVGPTLLMWLEKADPGTYRLIQEADRRAARRRRGHGPALAQVFNHIIMPLALSRDKKTQVLWGRAHFRRTFGRDPEGMWLSETAADLESLGLLAKNGLKFTVLAQNQLDAVRPLSAGRQGPWEKLAQMPDPRQPYRIFWGPGDSDFLDVFVYDGPVSRAVAFEQLLRDGSTFKERLTLAFGNGDGDQPRLVNLATDGESYGHHFHFGDMTLAWVFNAFETQSLDEPNPVKLSNYGEFLSLGPPRLEGRLVENSSWSCCHGVERWRSDCGCHTGGPEGWNQKWRTPLRDGLNWLRDELARLFEKEGGRLLKDPWAARDNYIDVVLSGFEPGKQAEFAAREAVRPPDREAQAQILALLEMQRLSMYMFTSCGWFFDDLAGLEPVQCLRYALRAMELASPWAEKDLAEGLAAFLRQAKPNDPAYATGEDVFREMVRPASLSPGQAAAHLAAARILEMPFILDEFPLLSHSCSQETAEAGEAGRLYLARASITDLRLGRSEDWQLLALLGPGRELDILAAPAGEAAEKTVLELWHKGGAASVLENMDRLWPGVRHFRPEDLWPSVCRKIMDEQVRDFFEDLQKYTQKSFE